MMDRQWPLLQRITNVETLPAFVEMLQNERASMLVLERIPDSENVSYHLAVLQVFGNQRRAPGIDCRSNDERVVEREPVPLGNLQPQLVDLKGQRHHLADGNDGFEHIANFSHLHAKLAQSHGGKFIEDLNADGGARSKFFFNPISLGCIGREQIQQNVGVEKPLSHAGSLRAGRSGNLRAGGPGTFSVAPAVRARRVS